MEQSEKQFILETLEFLKSTNYNQLQFIPGRKSYLGFFKEYENIINLFSKTKHLLFYYSVFPNFYLTLLSFKYENLKILKDFFFLNSYIDEKKIGKIVGLTWLTNGKDIGLIEILNSKVRLTFSVLPLREKLILRDDNKFQHIYQLSNEIPENRVYVGADSIKFASLNNHYLGDRNYNNCFEIGVGTGIQLINSSDYATRIVGVDVNPRAVDFSTISAVFNKLSGRFKFHTSDLFENVNEKFDLILANPWFIDLEKAGLEEIPQILHSLNEYLENGGVFAIYFGSYFKDGKDQGLSVLSEFCLKSKYEGKFYALGQSVEPHFFGQYKKLNISHINSYYGILIKNNTGSVMVKNVGNLRRVRDFLFINFQRVLYK